MSDDKKMDVLLPGHDYDGVQEFNNPAPFWWQLFFYISIAWGIGYFIYYQLMGGPTLDQELQAAMSKIQVNQAALMQASPSGPDEAVLAAAVADPTALATGAKVFGEKCAACHAPDGGGLIGPNLTDDYWIHSGGTLSAIYTVVVNGVPDKGMISWATLLTPEEIVGVTAYVKSLRGKPVATAKEPQGELVTQ